LSGTALWVAGSASLGDIPQAWAHPEAAVGWVTSSVQLVFIVGTLVSAVLLLADRFAPRALFLGAAIIGALANLTPLVAEGLGVLLAARFATGVALAGIYPVGMKIAASWYHKDLGKALGWLVGALVLGTAAPHAVVALGGEGGSWRMVLVCVSAVAALGGVAVFALVGDGPHLKKGAAFDPRAVAALGREPRFRSAALGYFGHMWELYALWAFMPATIAAWGARHGVEDLPVSWIACGVIALGAVGCIVGGMVALRKGSAAVATAQLATSATLALTVPWWSEAPAPVFFGLLAVWGVTVVGDSPQFSTLNALTAPRDMVGSALTIVTSVGFGITIVSIELVSWLSRTYSVLDVLPVLVLGPVMGLAAMQRLVREDPSIA